LDRGKGRARKSRTGEQVLVEADVVGVDFAYDSHRVDKDIGTAEKGERE